MRTKEEFYSMVKDLRKIAADPANQKCSCPKVKCEWHGRCLECVTLHRHFKDHVPSCFQQFINDKIKAIVSIGEMDVVEREKTPGEYWDYVREQDEQG
ncbi:MAG: hypothetical protein GY754_12660 [bacterium]|nr:hypothetical protein [bacterium]